ncbi:hypothetical protein DPX16_5773 [Anabarilius grahami]|uniref:Uncharacterized protein n=1 Tax=Anabarilius grahami TaxID=495550 RepID=A0A3N0YUX9_ANAGA|nr:hypothetical protein DPX16_5773 [Anabarilius grahami]
MAEGSGVAAAILTDVSGMAAGILTEGSGVAAAILIEGSGVAAAILTQGSGPVPGLWNGSHPHHCTKELLEDSNGRIPRGGPQSG